MRQEVWRIIAACNFCNDLGRLVNLRDWHLLHKDGLKSILEGSSLARHDLTLSWSQPFSSRTDLCSHLSHFQIDQGVFCLDTNVTSLALRLSRHIIGYTPTRTLNRMLSEPYLPPQGSRWPVFMVSLACS